MLRDNGASSLDPELRLLEEGCLTSFPSSSARFCRDPRGLGNGPFPALAGRFRGPRVAIRKRFSLAQENERVRLELHPRFRRLPHVSECHSATRA